MSNTLLPMEPRFAAVASEAMPVALFAKSLVDPEPSLASHAVDTTLFAAGMAENILNTREAVKQRDPVAFTLAAGLSYVYWSATVNHIESMNADSRPNWGAYPLKQRFAGALACGAFSAAQRVIDTRLGKLEPTSCRVREYPEY